MDPEHKPSTPRWGLAMGGVVMLLVTACSTGNSTAAPSGPLTVGLLEPITGKASSFAQFADQGAQLAADQVNASGGVMGRTLILTFGDTSFDAVDAVPALQQLLIHKPVLLIGPTNQEFPAVKGLIDSTKIPDFAWIPAVQNDTLVDKTVFDIGGPDSGQAKAMAFYALKKGWTKCSLIFDNAEVSQGLVQPLTSAYTAHGGTVVANVTLVPDATSYRSEVLQAFGGSPQCVFTQTGDAQTAGTLFGNLRQLGHLNVPFVGTNVYTFDDRLAAIGAADMSKWVTGTFGAAPSGASWDHFVQLWKARYGTAPNTIEAAHYDAVIIAALAMTAASSTDGKVWVNKILSVVNPPGTQVTTWEDGKKLLGQGTTINFVGASGINYFDPKYHNITTGWAMEQFDSTGKNLSVVFTVNAQDLQGW